MNNKVKNQTINFAQGLEILGFKDDDTLFLTETYVNDPQVDFHIEKAKKFKADAIYLRKQFTGNYKPQVYLFDFTNHGFSNVKEEEIAHIQKQIWSSGEAPLACFFFDTEIKIIDCTTSTKLDNDKYSPTYLVQLKIADTVHKLYNEQFAVKIKSGVFWEEFEDKNKFKFSNSAYDILIKWIQKVTEVLTKENTDIDKRVINKIIIQSILIKYLEDKKDDKEQNLFGKKYFPQFDNSKFFIDVLRKGRFVELLERLHVDFNGNLFAWEDSEKSIIKRCNLNVLANALEGQSHPDGQGVFEFIKLYEFNYIPVELISRLYEEFLAGNKKEGDKKKNKQDDGIFYTPSHLARLLVDEAMPLKNFSEIELDTYRVLDPACGSGIFLVIAFKRLVQWWRLQNGIDKPREVADLKKLLKCLFGTDKEAQATQLAAFSLCLALCDELSPMQIITKLRFDDLTKNNILYTDFFVNELKPNKDQVILLVDKQKTNFQRLNSIKFDLIIGNPPFKTGGISNYNNIWNYNDEDEVKIPQGQIALKFLSESLPFLKENGILCLIIKSSGLLYNSSSEEYKKLLFSKLNVIQIFDFTALAEGKSLWDNGARVGAAAIFLRKTTPDFRKNILHVTFRRTKATKERLVFEIDDYDLHFVNRDTAIENPHVWKSNLLGGGRIKSTIEKCASYDTFETFLDKNNCITGEGFIIGKEGKLCPDYVFSIPTLPTIAICCEGIDYSKLHSINRDLRFVKVPVELLFTAPNVILWENLGITKLPVFFNEISFSYKDKIVGIASNENDVKILKHIVQLFKENEDFYRFHIFTTSSQVLINRNTAVLKADYMRLPFYSINEDKFNLSAYDKSIIKDVNGIMRDFLVKGESSKAIHPIPTKEIASIIESYGNEFSSVLNLMYEEGNKKFRLDEVISIDKSFIATIFKYDNYAGKDIVYSNQQGLDLAGLSHHQVSKHLNANRIIKLYPQNDTIVFIKPNQYRYWISLIAYRDADKCFADLSKAGY